MAHSTNVPEKWPIMQKKLYHVTALQIETHLSRSNLMHRLLSQ